jgi:beta-mannosidase
LISPYTVDDKLKVDVINDKLEEINAELKLKLVSFDGKVIWENASLVTIPANAGTNIFEVNKNEFLTEYNNQIDQSVFVCELVQSGKVLSKNTFYFRPFKELKITKPEVTFEIAKAEQGFEISLKTDKLAKNIYLQIGDEEGFFSDNYFDLLPGEKVAINLKTKISEEKLKELLTLRTLDSAF